MTTTEETTIDQAERGTNGLATIDPAGKIPGRRLGKVGQARKLCSAMVSLDEKNAKMRAQVRGLLDGNAPYSNEELTKSGQGWRSNANFREMEARFIEAKSPLYDLVFGAPTLMSCVPKTQLTDDGEAARYGQMVTEAFDRLVREWDEFDFWMQVHHAEFIAFGVSPIIYPRSGDWRFEAIPISDFFVPRMTKAVQTKMPWVAIRRSLNCHELFKYIENPEAAKVAGWSVETVKAAIIKACKSGDTVEPSASQWEAIQDRLRNNDLQVSYDNEQIRIFEVLVREFDGKISHGILTQEPSTTKDCAEEDYLFYSTGAFESLNHVLQVFFSDTGNSYFHGIKGMLVRQFSQVDLMNRMDNLLADSAFLSGSLMMQPPDAARAADMNLLQIGPITVVPAGLNIIERGHPNTMNGPLGVMQHFQARFSASSGEYRNNQGPTEQTAEASRIRARKEAKLETGLLNRYLTQLSKLYAEMFRRAIKGQDHESKEMLKELREAGVPDRVLKGEWVVQAAGIVNLASATQRQLTFQDLLQLRAIPEIKSEQVILDFVSNLVGFSKARRYVRSAEEMGKPRMDTRFALLENGEFEEGKQMPVIDGDDHLIHAEVHLEGMLKMVEAVQQDMSLLKDAVQFLSLGIPHAQIHAQRMMNDPVRRKDGENLLGQVNALENFQKQFAALLKKQQELAAQQQQQAQADQQAGVQGQSKEAMDLQMKQTQLQAKLDADAMELQARLRHLEEKHAAEMQAAQLKLQQDLTLKDMEASARIQSLSIGKGSERPG